MSSLFEAFSMFKWVYNVSWRYFFVVNKNIYICIKAGIILNYCLLTYQQGYHPVPFSIMFNIFPENAIFAKYDICSHWFSIPCLQSGRQFFNVVCYYHGTVERHSVRKSLERAINIISLMKWGGEGILGVPVLLRFFFVLWMKENWFEHHSCNIFWICILWYNFYEAQDLISKL